jgi:hypothetical protein
LIAKVEAVESPQPGEIRAGPYLGRRSSSISKGFKKRVSADAAGCTIEGGQEAGLQKGVWAMSEQNRAIVRRIVEDYWNQRNPALAGELFAANCSLYTPYGDV